MLGGVPGGESKPFSEESQPYLDGQRDCTSHVNPAISDLLPPAPVSTLLFPYFLPLAEIHEPSLSGAPETSFPGLPLAPCPAASTLEPMLNLLTPCPLQPHMHQGPVLGAAGRVGKACRVC